MEQIKENHMQLINDFFKLYERSKMLTSFILHAISEIEDRCCDKQVFILIKQKTRIEFQVATKWNDLGEKGLQKHVIALSSEPRDYFDKLEKKYTQMVSALHTPIESSESPD